MQTIEEVQDNLKYLGYNGKFLESAILNKSIDDGPKSTQFREIIQWLCYEIHVLRNTEEQVDSNTEFSEFMLELSGLLKELGCQYDSLISGPLTDRYQTKESRFLLLDYLISELMAAKMNVTIKPEDTSYVIPKFESNTARSLEIICKDLVLGKPPDNIGAKNLFDKINIKLGQMMRDQNSQLLSEPLFKSLKPLNTQQWTKLDYIAKQLDEEYSLRKEMLMTRLDVTIQSFQWSEKMKAKTDVIINRYQEEIKKINNSNEDDIPITSELVNLLAARIDLAIIEKTSNAAVRKNTGSEIQKHVIGRVPDRGGRAYEHAPPPPEMPSWQQQRSSGPSAGTFGFASGGSGGSTSSGIGTNSFARGGYNARNSEGNRGNRGHGMATMNNPTSETINDVNDLSNFQSPNYQQPNYQHQNYQQQGYQKQNYQMPQHPYADSSGPSQWQRGDQQNSRVQGGWSNKGPNNGLRPSSSANSYGDFKDNRRGTSRGRSNYSRGGFRY